MLFKKSFQTKIEGANKVFIATLDKLKGIQTDISVKIQQNRERIQCLAGENAELDKLKLKTENQIKEISKFII